MRYTKDDVSRYTYNQKERIENLKARLEAIISDKQKQSRKNRNECVWCFTDRYVAGRSMTEFICKICNIKHVWQNTHTPIICSKCASENELCHMCGSDIDLRLNRRKKEA